MLDITWKVFSQTGNIETYLLFKELENVDNETDNDADEDESNEIETTQKM
ncbi:YqzL family protein [Oceanobacillus alkalisoli]|nr:YqzL family protein [Oceanobacillus alkalisoli]MCF3941798.1 YqzL family protein [Oceanobacillus alkalisoli]MCG5103078.1 YqzL family protein [Oceanobacillus alkalisoli]